MLSGAEGHHQVKLAFALRAQFKLTVGMLVQFLKDTLVRFSDDTWKSPTGGKLCVSVNQRHLVEQFCLKITS